MTEPTPEQQAKWLAFQAGVTKLAKQAGYDGTILAAVSFGQTVSESRMFSGFSAAPGVPVEMMRVVQLAFAQRLITSGPDDHQPVSIAEA